jgi:prepilin-type N-terminal cleavage/methylation domain-containing protein
MNPPLAKRPGTHGFTLVELLTVLAVVAILSVLSFPAISGVSSSANMNNAVNGISLVLEQARAYAMANNTYVWVGIAQSSSTQVTVGVVAGMTGQSTDISSSSTYAPIARVRSYNNFFLKSGITGLTSGLLPMSTASDITSSTETTFQQPHGAATVTFQDGTGKGGIIQFNPQGEASIGVTSQWIQIGLQPVQGSNTSSPNFAAFQVATLTGQVRIFRK